MKNANIPVAVDFVATRLRSVIVAAFHSDCFHQDGRRQESVVYETAPKQDALRRRMEWLEVAAMRGVKQQPEFYPEGDVRMHTPMMLDGKRFLRSNCNPRAS